MNNDFFSMLNKKKIALRGTGKEAENFLRIWKFYTEFYKKFTYEYPPKIERIFDNSKNKQGKFFHELAIEFPINIYDENIFIIVAIVNKDPIFNELEKIGYKKSLDYDDSDTFIKKIRICFMHKINDFLNFGIDNNILCLDQKSINNFLNTKENSIKKYSEIYMKIEISNLPIREKNLLCDLLLGSLLNQYFINDNFNIYDINKFFPMNGIISALLIIFGKDIEQLESICKKEAFSNKLSKQIKTIGIYNFRYSNGGAERVLSLLLPIFTELGYDVVLFTDDYDNNEYTLPDNVKRVVLKNSYIDNIRSRLDEYSYYIEKYNMNIMFYNYLYMNIYIFYETLYFKLLGIPVIAELHNTFLRFIDKKIENSDKWNQIFNIMDKIIVLSRIDERYWKLYSCNAKYIPNPIENGKKIWNLPIEFKNRTGKNIIWIGRTAAQEKHLFDAIEIIYKVRIKIPDVILNIVGEAEEIKKYEEIIKEKNLENNIIFHGYHSDVKKFYDNSDVMLMTSEVEGFPMVLAESKLYGVPTVMYELSYLELTRDLRGIIEVSQRDITKAADAVVKILTDDNLRHKMSVDPKRSLYPFIFYDIKNKWKEVFDEISK